jgi:hypothetical protein
VLYIWLGRIQASVYERRANGTWQLAAELASDLNGGNNLGIESVAVSGDGRVVAMGDGKTNEGGYVSPGTYVSTSTDVQRGHSLMCWCVGVPWLVGAVCIFRQYQDTEAWSGCTRAVPRSVLPSYSFYGR